jgi:hypothetical protein
MQVFDELRFVLPFAAFHICVFDAEDVLSACMAGDQPVVKRRAGVAYME